MTQAQDPQVRPTLASTPSLIEHAFPVARLSAESYKERDAKQAQRLSPVGKWWGRKPLVLVRATILGALLPATDDPQKDNEVFERLLGLDEEGLYERRARRTMTPAQFAALGSQVQLEEAMLAEAYEGPRDAESWAMINAHLGTSASSLQEVVEQLGLRRFGYRPKVGDVFSGGGSIPFEAARLGCDTYASDLNPVAALLTWSNQALLCATPEDRERIDAAQRWVYAEVDRQLTEWGVEHDEHGRRADAFLWCNEVRDPETGYLVPLSATWVISQTHRVVAELVPDHPARRYDIRVVTGASDEQLARAKKGTVVEQHLIPPPTPDHLQPHPTHLGRLRERQNGGQGLRDWEAGDLGPREGDFFQERLYCVRWVETVERVVRGRVKITTERSYEGVTEADLRREARCLELLRERLQAWQGVGFVPSSPVGEMNPKQFQLYARGWTYWHHLFTPRQLLTNGLFAEAVSRSGAAKELLALVGKVADWNSKACRWKPMNNSSSQTFSAQSISPLYNHSVRGFLAFRTVSVSTSSLASAPLDVQLMDARVVDTPRTIWITDPPYADAIPYEEVSEFFLAWYQKRLPTLFPQWYADSKRALALKGKGASFNESMIEVYSNLATLMPESGVQVVMFTHQDAAVWADLAMAMWASDLKVTAAWTVVTETTDGLKGGTNSVQGTVLLVLRKRGQVETLFDDEILALMEREVAQQIRDMQLLEGAGLEWSDADLQLATYAAALRVITSHDIDGLDPKRELLRVRARGEKSRVHELIEQASQVATRHLVPRGIDPDTWRSLGAHERFYLKGLETEQKGEHRSGVYQELARGFAAGNWRELLADQRANSVRLMTATEMGSRSVNTGPLAGTLLRHLLLAVNITAREGAPVQGLGWLRSEVSNFALLQSRAIRLLEHLGRQNLEHWRADAEAAQVLRGALMNAGV